MHVRGQVSFTGGNPFLHPHLFDLYRTARDKGLGLAILGNPTPMEEMERLMEISPPLFFQISLEGLAHHNDHIRGPGHFNRSLDFLDQLRQLGISSTVMLTLTRDNLDQVLPLGQLLQGRADRFTFNRLATVGEGARLKMPEPKEFEAFLRQYEEAARKNPILGLKDNLINIIRREKEKPLFGGCTGFGCGAAFNFVSLLPEGEVHACRKFSSPIGHILHSSLAEIYHSDAARAYRKGSEACQSCDLDPVCRGCLAITHSCGLDPFRDRDPFCFLKQPTDPPSRQEKGCS
jgi:selenobiotic family peptide radical SAM maturase